MHARTLFLATGGLLLALVVAAGASAGNRHSFGGSDSGCSVESPYTLRVDDSGVRLDAKDGDAAPQRIGFHDGALWVDGAARPVSAADAERLRAMEAGTRGLLPEIAGITREAIHITFDALEGVHTALNGNRRQARDIERLRERALARVAATLDRGVWSPDIFGDAFEAEIGSAAEAMAASFTPGRAIWMVLTGGIGRMERRMERMEVELERSIAEREINLEAHASALCARLDALHGLQESMEVRLDDGRPLRMFEFRHGGGPDEDALHAARETGA